MPGLVFSGAAALFNLVISPWRFRLKKNAWNISSPGRTTLPLTCALLLCACPDESNAPRRVSAAVPKPAQLAIACPKITPAPPPARLALDPFYRRYVDQGGIPIVGSDKVPGAAFAQTYYLVANMLRRRPCLRRAIVESGIRVGLIARRERSTLMPEYRDLNAAFPGTDWDKRGRGYGATLMRPLTSGAVENVLGDESGDRWRGELILLHEFAHTIFEFGVRAQSDGKQKELELERLHKRAIAAGRWKRTYAAAAASEYWAEGVQSFFDDNKEAMPPDGVHNHVNTREELASYDPGLAAFVATFFDGSRWPVRCDPSGGEVFVDPTPANPLAAKCALGVAYLAKLACIELRSPRGATKVRLTVVNRSRTRTLRIRWHDQTGKPIFRGAALGPRKQRTLQSYSGHAWSLAAESGSPCLGGYRLSGAENVIVYDDRAARATARGTPR